MLTTSRRQFLTATSALGAASALGLMAQPALAQQWPAKYIRLVTGSVPGSGNDVIVRYFAQHIQPLVSKKILVENRVGGNLAIEQAASAKPDGHTALLWGGNAVAGMTSLVKKPKFDPAKKLQAVATLNRQPFMIVVDAKSPHKSIGDLTKALLAKGDKARYGTSAVDAMVIGEIYKAKTGVKAVEKSYKSAADSLNDIANGEIDFAVHSPVFALQQQREGKWRILGVSSSERMQSLPDLPTMTEQGVPMNVIGWWIVAVPAGTPGPIVAQISKWFTDLLKKDETKKFLANVGGDAFITTPDEAQALLVKEIENWREYVKVAKIIPAG